MIICHQPKLKVALPFFESYVRVSVMMMVASEQYLRQKPCQCERCPDRYTHNELFYIKKESQSDYIISSQNSRIGSYIRPIAVPKDLLRSQNYITSVKFEFIF